MAPAWRHAHRRVVLGSAVRLAAGMARAGAEERNDPREDRAEQRQEDDRRIHAQPFIMLMSSTAIVPRLR